MTLLLNDRGNQSCTVLQYLVIPSEIFFSSILINMLPFFVGFFPNIILCILINVFHSKNSIGCISFCPVLSILSYACLPVIFLSFSFILLMGNVGLSLTCLKVTLHTCVAFLLNLLLQGDKQPCPVSSTQGAGVPSL